MTRYRIFISSTIDDLQDARAGVEEELSATEIFDVVRVEKLPATAEPSRRVCLDEVAAADALVLILGDRYGFVPESGNPDALSATHLEYREAERLGKPVFAFIRDGGAQEQELAQLIREISDFDEGVLRKKWASIDELRREVRRSLLFWIVRRARERHSQKDRQRVTTQLARFPEVSGLAVIFQPHDILDEKLQMWREELLHRLSLGCKRYLLPAPYLTTAHADGSAKRVLVIGVQSSSAGRLAVAIDLRQKHGDEEQSPISPKLELDVAWTPEGAKFVADASLAFTFLAADDWSRCLGGLSAASTNRNATHGSRASLLKAAAFVSASNRGARSSEIVRLLLDLPSLEPSAVNAGVLCLVAAQFRYEIVGARYALEESERLALRLLMLALSRNEATPEVLYNLARQCLKYSPSTALSFYKELLKSDPSYDERWYFHRDLGLLYYDARRLIDAAKHYDQACSLKSNDSELWRFAGDAYYYSGHWAEALLRYEKAVEIEAVEMYFLDEKMGFARARFRRGIAEERNFERKRSLSGRVSKVGVYLAQGGHRRLAQPLFTIAKALSDLNFEADKWLALYSNRRARFGDAIIRLKGALASIPEDPSVRLNLVVNMIFNNDRREFTEEAQAHARIAIFHGGPTARDRFRLSLMNTPHREDLCKQFSDIFDSVQQEWGAWRGRRKEVLAPQAFGQVLHTEWRL
jgi:tetratricopeptide (TPR) repeat protein